MLRTYTLAIFCAATLVWVSTSDAALVHRYSFTSDANDSVGGAHGTIVDAGVMPNFTFAGGMLDFSANTGQNSNVITEDAYVDLPNGIVSTAAAGGQAGAISFEFWATVAETHRWQRFGDFGTSNNGEDTSDSGSTSQYVLISPNSGRHNDGLEITNHPASNAGEPNVGVPGPLANNVEHHVVAVYDHNDTSAGPNGTMTLYHNGVRIGSNSLHPDFNVTNAVDNNNWLGRSQWGDPVFDGSYNEFRIYDSAVSAGHVQQAFAFGADRVVPEPGALVLMSMASLAILTRRRRG